MKKFMITATVVFKFTVPVSAETLQEAIDKAQDAYYGDDTFFETTAIDTIFDGVEVEDSNK